jgi:hypothetical protein
VHFLPLHIVFSVIVFLAAYIVQAGTTEVILPDTLVKQGSLIELPLSVKTSTEAMFSPCSVIVSIPKRRIILKDAMTKPGTLFTCKKPIITILSENSSNRTYSISCQNPLLQSEGILFFLQLEVLAGIDSISTINTLSFSIGDSTQSIVQSGGKIRFSDPLVIQAQAEGMDINLPNPFSYTTSFTYYVGKEGEVHFTLYDSQGKLIQDYPIERKSAGRHIFDLKVDDPYNFPSGVYIIRMRTERGLYHMSMVHKK